MEEHKILDLITNRGVRVTVGKGIDCKWEYLKHIVVNKIYNKQVDSYSFEMYFSYVDKNGTEIEEIAFNLHPKKQPN